MGLPARLSEPSQFSAGAHHHSNVNGGTAFRPRARLVASGSEIGSDSGRRLRTFGQRGGALNDRLVSTYLGECGLPAREMTRSSKLMKYSVVRTIVLYPSVPERDCSRWCERSIERAAVSNLTPGLHCLSNMVCYLMA